VGHEVEGEVEGRDERADPDGHALEVAAVPASPRAAVEGHALRAHADALLGRRLEGLDQASDLASAVADGLPSLAAERVSELVRPLAKALHAVIEDGAAVARRASAEWGSREPGRLDRPLDRGGRGRGDLRQQVARELVPDLEPGSLVRLLAREPVPVALPHGRRVPTTLAGDAHGVPRWRAPRGSRAGGVARQPGMEWDPQPCPVAGPLSGFHGACQHRPMNPFPLQRDGASSSGRPGGPPEHALHLEVLTPRESWTVERWTRVRMEHRETADFCPHGRRSHRRALGR
jgi:hypothetical protein